MCLSRYNAVMNTTPQNVQTLIIGAGLAGLHLGNLLQKKGRQSLILEKSRGVGGRLSTRRIENMGFDHGAAYLSGTKPVRDLLSAFNFAPAVQTSDEQLFFKGGMSALPKRMAETLQVMKEVRAQKLEAFSSGWKVTTDVGQVFTTQTLVIATPMPQARDLLSSYQEAKLEMPTVEYSKKLLSLNVLHTDMPESLQTSLPDGILPQIARGLHPRGLIFYGDDAFSEKYFDHSDEEILNALHKMAEEKAGVTFDVKSREVKKWRYSRPLTVIPDPFLEVAPHLFVIGDCFKSLGVSSAIDSAESLSQHLN